MSTLIKPCHIVTQSVTWAGQTFLYFIQINTNRKTTLENACSHHTTVDDNSTYESQVTRNGQSRAPPAILEKILREGEESSGTTRGWTMVTSVIKTIFTFVLELVPSCQISSQRHRLPRPFRLLSPKLWPLSLFLSVSALLICQCLHRHSL